MAKWQMPILAALGILSVSVPMAAGLKCFGCMPDEDLLLCNATRTEQVCESGPGNISCFAEISHDGASFTAEKGCTDRAECLAKQLANPAECDRGVVDETFSCTFCCDDDLCNWDHHDWTTEAPGLECHECDGDSPAECLADGSDVSCAGTDQVCFVELITANGYSEAGCLHQDQCSESANSADCYTCQGCIDCQCTFCCSDNNSCNKKYLVDRVIGCDGTTPAITTTTRTTTPTTTENVVTTIAGTTENVGTTLAGTTENAGTTLAGTTENAGTCWPGDASHCLPEFKNMVDGVLEDPMIYFGPFCRNLSSIIDCVSVSIFRCCNSSEADQNLLVFLKNMKEICPDDCSYETALNCSIDFHHRTTDVIIDPSGNCDSIRDDWTGTGICIRRNIVSCDQEVKKAFNYTEVRLDEQVKYLCDNWLPAVSTNCSFNEADVCIKLLGREILGSISKPGMPGINHICNVLLPETETCVDNSIEDCSIEEVDSIYKSLNFTRGLISEVCEEVEVPICDTDRARSCILELWQVVEEGSDFQKACAMRNGTIECVDINTRGCSESVRRSLFATLDRVLEQIADRCEATDTIIIWPQNETIWLEEGRDPYFVHYVLTETPVTFCKIPGCKVFVEFEIEMRNSPKCRKGGNWISQVVLGEPNNMEVAGNYCSREVTPTNYDTEQTVSLMAKLDFKKDGNQKRTMFVWLRKFNSDGIAFESHSIMNFTLIVLDADTDATCKSINDPHITTFDGSFYNNFMEGFFLLYANTDQEKYPFEVQAVYQKCSNKATCNCAVSVRSGDTVFHVDRCRRSGDAEKQCADPSVLCYNLMKIEVYFFDEITSGTRIFIRDNGKKFVVILPFGQIVTIATSGEYLNVWITPSPVDRNRTQGLCGFYDSNKATDLKLRNGTIYRGPGSQHGGQPLPFSRDWRVPSADRINQGVREKNPASFDIYCDCRKDGKAENCSASALLEFCDFDLGQEITGPMAERLRFSPQNTGHRTKRSLFNDDHDYDIDESNDNFFNISRELEDEARQTCSAFFEQSQPLQLCIENDIGIEVDDNMEGCIEDFIVSDNSTEWLQSGVESAVKDCLDIINKNMTYSDELQEIAEKIDQVSCLNDCHQQYRQGKCENGQCNCTSIWIGADCSVNSSAPPFILGEPRDSECDVRDLPSCRFARIFGWDFVSSRHFSCELQQVDINETGVEIVGEKIEVNAEVATISQLLCPIPPDLPDTTSFLVRIRIGQGQWTDKTVLHLAFDSVCYECTSDQEPLKSTCKRKTDTSCVIGEQCFAAEEIAPDDKCKICLPAEGNSDWSSNPISSCQLNIGMIIGLTVASVAFLAAVIVGVIVGVRRSKSSSLRLSVDGSSSRSFGREDPSFEDQGPVNLEELRESQRTYELF